MTLPNFPLKPPSDFSPRRIVIAAALTFGVSLGALYTSTTLVWREFNRNQGDIVNRAQTLYQQERYSECITASQQVSDLSIHWLTAQILSDGCRQTLVQDQLSAARSRLEQGQLHEAASILETIPREFAAPGIRSLIEEVADRLLAQADAYYAQETCDYLSLVLAALKAVPSTSDRWAEAQQLIQQRQTEYSQNQQQLSTANTALQRWNLEQATQALNSMSPHPCWQNRMGRMQQQIESMKLDLRSTELLRQANEHLKQCEPENATTVAQALLDGYPWGERKANLIDRASQLQTLKDWFGTNAACWLAS